MARRKSRASPAQVCAQGLASSGPPVDTGRPAKSGQRALRRAIPLGLGDGKNEQRRAAPHAQANNRGRFRTRALHCRPSPIPRPAQAQDMHMFSVSSREKFRPHAEEQRKSAVADLRCVSKHGHADDAATPCVERAEPVAMLRDAFQSARADWNAPQHEGRRLCMPHRGHDKDERGNETGAVVW